MKVLAVDTATECCSAALLIDGQVRSREHFSAREHAERLLPMVDELLAEAGLRVVQLDGLAFGRGPGGFTGVRIATGVVQGLAFGADLPVAPVSDLTALAARAWRLRGAANVLAVLDARMGETYWSAVAFDGAGHPRTVVDECVAPPEALALPDALPTAGGREPGEAAGTGAPEAWFGAGPGWAVYADALAPLAERLAGVDATLFPHAHEIALLGAAMLAAGEGVPAEQAVPVYLRDRVASVPPTRP